jgi:hypothetical protein
MATTAAQPKGNETPAVRWCVHTIRTRMATNVRAWEFYEGTQAEVMVDRRLRRRLQQYGRAMRVNMARTPVTAVVDRLTVDSWMTTGDEDALAELLDDQDVDGLAHELHERAEAMGESFALVWPDAMAETGPEDDPTEQADGVVITLHDPTEMVVRYDDEHRNVVEYAGRLWLDDDDRHRVNVYYPDRVERWRETAKSSDLYDLLPDDDDDPASWEYPDTMQGRVPVFHYRTNRTPHGRPGHADAIPVQSILDKLVATDMAMVDFAGFPIRYAIHRNDPGAAAAYDDPKLDDPDSTTDATESADGRVGKLKASPAAFWNLDADAVGEFSPADPKVILERQSHYMRALLSVSDTPLSEWEGIGANQSGEAQRQEEKSLLRKVGRRQRLYGRTHAEMLAYALAANGSDGHVITVGWADPSETNDTDAWAVTAAKVATGLPLHAALQEHGYDAEELAELGLAEDAGLAPDVLGRLVQQLSSSIPVALDRDDLRAILADYGVTLGPGDGDDPEVMPPALVS